MDKNFVAKQIMNELAFKIDKALSAILPILVSKTKASINENLSQSKEAASLLFGTLRGELGVVNALPTINGIIGILSSNVRGDLTKCTITGNSFLASLKIYIYNSEINDSFFALPEASFISEGGFNIPWLKWLLTRGDEIIIAQHEFVRGVGQSRTGTGTMQPGGSWKVPSEFSGVENDNWITKSLVKILPVIESEFIKELEKRL